MTYHSPIDDLFASYGNKAIPAPQLRAQMRKDKAPSAFEEKMFEKQRLSAQYRKWRTAEARATLASEPRLRDFNRYLRTVQPHDSDELIEAIADSWLPSCRYEVRYYALRMVMRHCDRLNLRMGHDILDDPLPLELGGEEPGVYFRARDILVPGGRC